MGFYKKKVGLFDFNSVYIFHFIATAVIAIGNIVGHQSRLSRFSNSCTSTTKYKCIAKIKYKILFIEKTFCVWGCSVLCTIEYFKKISLVSPTLFICSYLKRPTKLYRDSEEIWIKQMSSMIWNRFVELYCYMFDYINFMHRQSILLLIFHFLAKV